MKASSIRGFVFVLVAALVLVPSITLQAAEKSYNVHILVSDTKAFAPDHVDANLVNAWGIAFNPNGPIWIADNGTGVSTLYDGSGAPVPLIVTIPPPAGGTPPSAPTGIVFNSSSDFLVPDTTKPSLFIFATEDGTISAWAQGLNPSDKAILAVDNSLTGAVYKGLALAANGTDHFLYATDFHNGRIDVFDKTFKAATLPGSFTDPHLPAGFAPFGIRNINGNLYVTYAKQDADKHDDVAGQGNGFVNIFDANGNLIDRFASRGQLNSPWGMALAPADFGGFSNRLLIGNFGDGHINAFNIGNGTFVGELRQEHGKKIVIDGLWGLSFGNGVRNFPVNVLFFTAGPNHESNGLFGKIEVEP